jgi:hypothetical protein
MPLITGLCLNEILWNIPHILLGVCRDGIDGDPSCFDLAGVPFTRKVGELCRKVVQQRPANPCAELPADRLTLKKSI